VPKLAVGVTEGVEGGGDFKDRGLRQDESAMVKGSRAGWKMAFSVMQIS